MRLRWAAALAGATELTLLLGLPGAALAEQQRIAVRVGEFQGAGRIALVPQTGGPPGFRMQRDGDRVVLHFSVPARLDMRAAPRPPRHASALAPVEQGLAITLRGPDVRIRQEIRGNRVLLELVAPAAETARTPIAERAASPAPPARDQRLAAGTTQRDERPATGTAQRDERPAAGTVQPEERHTAATAQREESSAGAVAPREERTAPSPATTHSAPRPAPAQATAARTGSPPGAAVAAAPVLPPADATAVRLVFGAPGQPPAVVLPFGEDTGIAVLRRGETLLIVLDTVRPLNLAALRADAVFGGMETRIVPGGTVLTLRLAEPGAVVARRRDGAWSLTASPVAPIAAPAALDAMTQAPGPGLLIRTQQANRVLALPDPETGLPLLVGTVRRAGLTLSHLRRLPEGDLLPSLVGVATLARSDRFALRAMNDGFLVTGTVALDPAVAGPEPARAMTRTFDIPALPLPTLRDRLRAEHVAVRAAPPLGRAPLRRVAAETLLALGMPQEAQAMLELAAAENPAVTNDPVMAALTGVAALLAGRLGEASGLARSDLPEQDETMLWRAMLDAARGDASGAAPRLAATLPLALAYPEALRLRVLGPIAEAMAEAGHRAGLRALTASGAEAGPAQAFAEAALAEVEGRTPDAVAAYARLADGRDRLLRARALRRGIELRLAAGEIDAARAADALEAALFAWRGDLQEVSARRRVAALRLEAGEPQPALAMLRETATLFPDQAQALRPALQDAFLATLMREAPLAAVSLYDAEPGLLPADARGDAALLGLAERLAALDLPSRAVALLRPAMQRATPGGLRRAELGLRVAQLLLEDGEAAATLEALAESQADALPAELAEARGLLAARAEARLGRRDGAMARLRALGAAGAEPLAEMLVESQDWTSAARALEQHLAARIADAAEPLSPAEGRLVLRQAALLALANDSVGLSTLAARFGPRLGQGPLADAFGALTADPMRGIADLPRLQRELRLFRALPSQAEPVRAASLETR